MKCERCGSILGRTIYIGDFLSSIIAESGDSIDLCNRCYEEIIILIETWWDFKSKR